MNEYDERFLQYLKQALRDWFFKYGTGKSRDGIIEILNSPEVSMKNKILTVWADMLLALVQELIKLKHSKQPWPQNEQLRTYLNEFLAKSNYSQAAQTLGRGIPEIKNFRQGDAFLLWYFVTHPNIQAYGEGQLTEADKKKLKEQDEQFTTFLNKTFGEKTRGTIDEPEFMKALEDFIKKERPEEAQEIIEHLTPFFTVGNSPASNLVMEVLGAGKNVADLPARKRKIRSSKLEVMERGNQRQIILKEPKAEITLELADIDKLSGNNKPAKNFFVLALQKANEQAIHNGELTRNFVSFPLKELIEIGLYSTPQSARAGFKRGMDALTSLKVKGKIRKSKKSESTIEGIAVLFPDAWIKDGQCMISFNDRINWNFMIQYYTILPKYYFRLSDNAGDLLYYIFYLARQHTRDIAEKGYFNISFRAIYNRLNLPDEKTNPNPQRDIKRPIEKAIEELEDRHKEAYGNMEFGLLPVYDDEAPIESFLDNGYLQVKLSGEFAKDFIAISQKNAQRIETAQKQKARIVEKAKAINMAKKMEAEGETSPAPDNP